MGNGVAVDNDAIRSSTKNSYEKLEKLCRKGYFHQDHKQYIEALEQAIRMEYLDCLELLLVSGDIRKALPLHLACQAAKLETVELMLSAGFSGELRNNEGRTPLHMCCPKVNPEAGLCASLLSLRFPRSLKIYDYMGQAPIHFAVRYDNAYVLKVLVQIDSSLATLPDQTGKTPIDIARVGKSDACLDFLRIHIKSSNNKRSPMNEVDQERIMEVWERFFENAFKRAEMMSDFEVHDQISRALPLVQTIPSDRSNLDYSDYDLCDDWFDWIVCYDQDSTNDYFVVNRFTQDRMWLSDFVSYVSQYRSYRFLSCSYDTIASISYPQSLDELRDWGWLIFYSDSDNYCQWMNIMTTSFEMFLPLGMREDLQNLLLRNLSPSNDDEAWFEADQSCTYAWVMVVTEDNNNYFLNTWTHHTRWDPPQVWEDLLTLYWNNWILCCPEKDLSALFW